MKTSESIAKLSADFVKAQAELKNAVFDKVNPHFKSKYATLSAVRDTITPILAKHNLAVLQGLVRDGESWFLATRLLHSSGEWIETEYPFGLAAPQAMGSNMTYARRYSLSAICNIASEEDDDANATKDQKPDASKPIDETQFRYLQDLIEKSGSDEEKMLAFLKADNLESLNQYQYKTAETLLRKKITQKDAPHGNA